MGVFVALYRGINVGGKHSIKMEALRALHEALGHGQVTSYIQSGNIVFGSSGAAEAIARQITAAFEEAFGFSSRLLLVTKKRWGEIVAANPYAKHAVENPKTVHVGLCDGSPDAAKLHALLAKTAGSESVVCGKDIVYLHAPDGFGTSKFAAGMEKACGVAMTARNWRTMEEIWKIASGMS